MKKYISTLIICILSLAFVFTGCDSIKLENSPTKTANTIIYGSALSYDDYIYFANSYETASKLTFGENNNNADNASIYRIKLNDNRKIPKNEDTNLPENLERAVQKIAGMSNSLMFSANEYIYFASPSTHRNNQNKTMFDCTSYFRVKTDGTDLKEFYTTSTAVTQQVVLTLDDVNYLFVVNDGNLVKINLDTLKNVVLLNKEDDKYTSVILANKAISVEDKYAYYLTSVDPDDTEITGRTGSYIHTLDLITGEKTETPINQNTPATITLKKVYKGNLFFTIAEKINGSELTPQYKKYEHGKQIEVSPIVDSANISDFEITTVNNTEYYIYANSSDKKTYALTENSLDIAKNILLDKAINILFSHGSYLYYTDSDNSGIYRISVRDKKEQTISNVKTFKTDSIAFDGTYIYFYATMETNAKEPSGTYYLHRAKVDVEDTSGNLQIDLLSQILDKDIPTEEEKSE